MRERSVGYERADDVVARVTHRLLLVLAERGAFPAVRIGARLVACEHTWLDALTSSTPQERATLLLGLHDDLLRVTEGGRAYLAAAEARDAAAVDEEPYLRGDPELLDTVRAALALLPDIVRWPVQRDTAFLGVGISSRAWTSPAAFVDVTDRKKGHLVVLGPQADVLTVIHECAHVWNMGPPRRNAIGGTVQGRAGLVALAMEGGWWARNAACERAEEDLATGLSLCWLLARSESRPS